MNIRSADFIAGITQSSSSGIADTAGILKSELPKIAFIGRSNVGKSSLINALTGHGIARTSPEPGHTRQINVYLINKKFHLVDLPGYGFASGSLKSRQGMTDLIEAYLFNPDYTQQRIVFIVDGSIGMTDKDMNMFNELVHFPKDFVIVASKVDKLNQSERHHNLAAIRKIAGAHPVFPISSTEKTGLDELTAELFDIRTG